MSEVTMESGAPSAAPVRGLGAPDGTGWDSLHLFLHSTAEEADAFLTEDLGPLLAGLVDEAADADWFFIRYGEGGPHLRIRTRGLDPDAVGGLPAALARLAAARPAVGGPWPSDHAEVRAVPYRPETERYGGAPALPVAEHVFTASTRVALQVIARSPRRADRLVLAADLAHATGLALGMDRLGTAQWLRRHAASWHWTSDVPLLPAPLVHARSNTVFTGQRPALARRAEAVRQGLLQGTAEPWALEWAQEVRTADQSLRDSLGDAAHAVRGPWIWASQLHMLCNRLGVTPDEERALCRLAARTLLDTGEEATFFPSDHRCPDRQYLERSKFQPGGLADSAPRPVPAPATGMPPDETDGSARQEIPLAARALPAVPLHAALTGRVSARGPLTGPLTAAELGTVLWNAHAVTHRTERQGPDGTPQMITHRPYPSAGALYTAAVRVLVLDVDGVPGGCYQCVPERRALRRIGAAPDVEDVKGLSSYLSRPADDPEGIGIDAAPVLLGLYADLGLLRRRYGLRALRLGLLEVGHLAQTLLLTASALGLSATPIGGFHDDLAHEVFGLDDLDQPLQYLLPLGRGTGAAPVPLPVGG